LRTQATSVIVDSDLFASIVKKTKVLVAYTARARDGVTVSLACKGAAANDELLTGANLQRALCHF